MSIQKKRKQNYNLFLPMKKQFYCIFFHSQTGNKNSLGLNNVSAMIYIEIKHYSKKKKKDTFFPPVI